MQLTRKLNHQNKKQVVTSMEAKFRRRVLRELDDVKSLINENNSIRNLTVDEDILLEWKLKIFSTENESYDIQINFPGND